MAKPTISMSDELLEEFDGLRRGGQTRSVLARRAFRTYIYAAQCADGFDGELPDQWIEHAIEEHIYAAQCADGFDGELPDQWVKHAIKEYLDQRRVEQRQEQEQEVLADG